MTAPAGAIVALVRASQESASRLEPVRLACALAVARGGEPTAIVAGGSPADDAAAAQALGAHRVWTIAHPSLAEPPDAEQLLTIFRGALSAPEVLGGHAPDLVLLPVGPVEEEVAVRLAAALGGVALGRCLDIAPNGAGFTAVRPAYGGRVLIRIAAAGRPCVAVVLPGARSRVAAVPVPGGDVRSIRPTVALPPADHITRVATAAGRQARLEGAKVVVSGGRGLGGAEGFAALAELAECLGGAIGGSLPAADAGWIPVSRQIGQSGKYVAPDIYVAVGISGTTQHIAGIDPRSRIVAINHDPHAPIFDVAELGAVGDWRDVLPALVRELRASLPR